MKKFHEKKQLYLLILVFMFLFINTYQSEVFAAKPDKLPPSAPADLRAVTVNDKTVSLVWFGSTDKSGIRYYEIYQNNVLIGNTTLTTYTADGLIPSQNYKFYVKARDLAGNLSGPSNTVAVTTSPLKPGTRIVGYYGAWAAYSGFYPDLVDAGKLTHINYAFANIGSDLKISLGYPDIDLANFIKLNTLKNNYPGLKTIISVGGWSWSGRFSDAAFTDAARTAFADSCVDFIVKYGFDGVDIDWEYPVSGGLVDNAKRPEDKRNFTLLLQKLREKLDKRGQLDGKHYILSFAGPGSNSYINNTELNLLEQYVDYGNIMTYDIHGTWDSFTDFNAPLYPDSDISPQYKWSVDESVNTWLKTGFPADKIVMGVPFYGYLYSAVTNQNNGLYQSFLGSSSISYANVAGYYLNKPGYSRSFKVQSKVPWLFNGSVFISYEDEESIGYKAQYIKDKGLGGAMIWELSQDPNRVLLNSLYMGMGQ